MDFFALQWSTLVVLLDRSPTRPTAGRMVELAALQTAGERI
ncbi:MAG: hypothetical protein QOH17_2979 [Pseudonocardiales bacterium]|jgi:hypothetical protein|nr:hypothetical protein [Pseudonocardiales bacterium]